jgi:hypothetical protein
MGTVSDQDRYRLKSVCAHCGVYNRSEVSANAVGLNELAVLIVNLSSAHP